MEPNAEVEPQTKACRRLSARTTGSASLQSLTHKVCWISFASCPIYNAGMRGDDDFGPRPAAKYLTPPFSVIGLDAFSDKLIGACLLAHKVSGSFTETENCTRLQNFDGTCMKFPAQGSKSHHLLFGDIALAGRSHKNKIACGHTSRIQAKRGVQVKNARSHSISSRRAALPRFIPIGTPIISVRSQNRVRMSADGFSLVVLRRTSRIHAKYVETGA